MHGFYPFVIQAVLSYIWIFRLGKPLGLLCSIFVRTLPNALFVLFNLLFLLLSGANIAFRRKANEVRGDQGKVFTFFCVHDSRCFRASSEDFLWPPSISQPCMSLYSKHTTVVPSSILCVVGFCLKVSLRFLA